MAFRRAGAPVAAAFAMLLLFAAAGAAPEAAPPETTVLAMARNRNWEGGAGTIWRYYEVWQTELVRKPDGKLVRVDPLYPRLDYDAVKTWGEEARTRKAAQDQSVQIREANTVKGAPLPPADWAKVEFDDSRWVRTPIPMGSSYRSLALLCLRGKFTVTDPAQAGDLTLTATFQGGAVFYLNGKEVGRANLPAGAFTPETPAEDYPNDAFLDASGQLLPHPSPQNQKDADLVARQKLRTRTATVTVPAAALRAGNNVLAVEIHRAPAAEAMFTKISPARMGYGLSDHYNWFWNRATIEDLKLTAKAPPSIVQPNTGRPALTQVWNHPIWERVDLRFYGDPGDALQPLHIRGARNGTFSDQVVVSSTNASALANLQAAVEPSGSRALPAGWVQVRYPAPYRVWQGQVFEPIETTPPTNMIHLQPVWVSVNIPQDAKAGDYTATLAVSANGLASVRTPVQVHVSDWTLPPPSDYVAHMAFIQSPESVSLTYNVPMWSKEHWDLIDQSFRVLADTATKEINLPLVRRTHFGNEHGMLWWVRKPDGTLAPKFDIVEKYIATAARHLVKIPVVVFYVIEADADGCPWITEFDPATGELKNAKAPPWGTPEARAFWQPAFEGFRKILAKHGLEKSLALGYHAESGNGPCAPGGCIDDMKIVAPEARWVRVGHFWGIGGKDKLEVGPGGNPWARVSLVAGNYGVGWDPETDKPFYGWRNPYPVLAYTRDACFREYSQAWVYRLAAETVLLSGQRQNMPGWGVCDIAGMFGRDTFLGCKGFGPLGADFWTDVVSRFNDPAAGTWDPRSCWSTVQLDNGGVIAVIGRGTKGPVPSLRTECLREGLQEAEARVFCQEALLDDARRAKLGPDIEKRCREVCDDQTRALRLLSEFRAFGTGKGQYEQNYIFQPAGWQDLSLRLYEMAAEVSKAR